MRKPLIALAAAAALLVAAAPAAGAPAPAWNLVPLAAPTNFAPGASKGIYYQVEVANIGAAPTNGSPIEISYVLPGGLTVKDVELWMRKGIAARSDFGDSACGQEKAGAVVTVRCEVHEAIPDTTEPAKLWPGEFIRLKVWVAVPGSASGALLSEVAVEGGGAGAVTVKPENQASAQPAPAGIARFGVGLTGPAGEPATQAASHPYSYITGYAVNTELSSTGSTAPLVAVGGDPRNLKFELPPGLIGNPTAVPRCTAAQFVEQRALPNPEPGGGAVLTSGCPDASAVGAIAVSQVEGASGGTISGAIYNLVPPPGMPAQLGFQVAGAPIYIDTELRTGSDYGITAQVRNLSQSKRVSAAEVTLWGVPADPSHDRQRGFCAEAGAGVCPSELVPRAFLRLPTSCAAPLLTRMIFESWQTPGALHTASQAAPAPLGCAVPKFEPSIEARPTTTIADSPSGLRVKLHLPQNEDPAGPGTADLREARVTLPPGLLVNPSSAAGLEGCAPAQIDLRAATSPTCPGASKLGTVEVSTPLVEHALPGAVYLASPHDNPFGSLLAIYIVVEDPISGVVVKLAGRVEPDPVTGQLTTTVKDNPQTPFEDFELDFFEGPRAPLHTPPTCGAHTAVAQLTPHSAPAFGPPATPSDSWQITTAPGGGHCPSSEAELPHAPGFDAGTMEPLAGHHSPLLINLRREDGSQRFSALTLSTPPGLLAKLAGTPACPDASLAVAAARPGKVEQVAPACPAASRLGAVHAAAGAGPAPYWAPGAAYLAGPYKGAPLSLAILTPAVAGPFDLGTIVVRTALYVDPATARITAVSDPIPAILQGIPLNVRRVAVRLDKPDFTLNPTSCDPMALSGQLLSTLGAPASLHVRFQLAECGRLGFKPRMGLRLIGPVRRGANPSLRAIVRPRPGQANIGRAAVRMPRSAFLDQSHIRTICTRVQWAADNCPKGSIYGRAVAHSPLLDYPLRGNVYLRSSNNPLPDLVADLRGPAHQPIRIELSGRTDSVRGALRNTFDSVPDAPVSYFRLQLFGGKRGLIVNSRNICQGVNRAVVGLTAQSGRRTQLRPALVNQKCKKVRRAAKRKAAKRKAQRRAQRASLSAARLSG